MDTNCPLLESRAANGALMPSTAEDVFAASHMPSLRTAGSRRYALEAESFLPMAES